MKELITMALAAAGYEGPPTPESLTECFMDYVAAGVWRDLDSEEAQDMIGAAEITPTDMCRALIKLA